MSKRFYPQQPGDRKKAKLDISISDHNFPLSQNNELKDDNWGDDNDDEILLLASQACEQAYGNNDFSQIPDYSICMQPGSTSTQMQPSTSKTEFTFKKPSFDSPSAISTHLKEKCDRISSPLPGISSKVHSKVNGHSNFIDDLIINDKVFKNQDADYVYKQLLQLQEENAKLKSENGKLLEKCVTKEGEASILRTQLKSSQIAVDNARLEKIKAQERVQVEWNEKLATANIQMQDLRNQLDFKNLEIISIKEKCKKLESSKIKLTQVTVGSHDISVSHRNNNTIQNDSITRRVKTCTNIVQTDNHLHFFKLNKIHSIEQSNLTSILPLILEPTTTQQHSILDYNEKLHKTTDLSQNRCRIYSTFHRVPTTPVVREVRRNILISSVYEDVTSIAQGVCDGEEQRFLRILNFTKQVLSDTQAKLEELCQRVTTSFQKEMDERYMETSLYYLDVTREDLLKGSSLYKEEHDILARRMVAVFSYILETSRGKQWYTLECQKNPSAKELVTLISNICRLLNNASCATLYSGLILSTSYLLQSLPTTELIEIIKTILLSRPMTFVLSQILVIVTILSGESSLSSLCPGTSVGNLKTDYDQGVVLYKKDSCYIQILLKQMETCLKCIEKQNVLLKAIETARQLIILYYNVNDNTRLAREKSRCDCQLMLVQLIVYSLRVCAVMLHKISSCNTTRKELLSVCRCGIQVLYQCVVRDVEFSSQLAHNEGHLIEFCDIMRVQQHSEVFNNMLSELSSTLQSSPEEMPPSFHRQPWLKSFESFSLVD